MATLTFNQKVPGPNALPLIYHYPTSRTVIPITINSGGDITGYTLEADYETLIFDTIQMDRGGNPNFSNSTQIGNFPKVEISGADVPVITDASTGSINLIIPENVYTGPILVGDQTNVPVTVVSLTIINADGFKDSLRQPLYISYEPDVVVGDPTLEPDYVAKG